MAAFAMARMPEAVSSRPSPSGPAIESTAACAASTDSAISPPRKASGSISPSARLASVTVGSVPPRP